MNTSEVLYLAANAIEEHGWTQGPSGWFGYNEQSGGSSALCLEGALMAVTGRSWQTVGDPAEFWGCPAYRAVERHLDAQPHEAGRLFLWNDADDRTASEVIEVLRACAVIEASRERAAVQA